MPGFVDCHTHAVFFGNRAEEFEARSRGMSYAEIAKQGGGIRSSMKMLREATDEQLEAQVRTHYDRFPGPRHDDDRGEVGLRAERRARTALAAGARHRT